MLRCSNVPSLSGTLPADTKPEFRRFDARKALDIVGAGLREAFYRLCDPAGNVFVEAGDVSQGQLRPFHLHYSRPSLRMALA